MHDGLSSHSSPEHRSGPRQPHAGGFEWTTAQGSGLSIVPYEHARHESALLSLYSRVLGDDAGAGRRAVHASIVERMPGRERAPLRFVMLDGDNVAGTLGYLPADFLVRGARVAARFTFDLMVDPRHAFTGLQLARKTLGTLLAERARLHGDFLVGGLWMTPSSHRIHLAAGFDDALTLPSYTLPLAPKQFVANRQLHGGKAAVARIALNGNRVWALTWARVELAGRDPVVEPCDRFDASHDDAWYELARTYDVTRVRDAAYLNWKYADHPHLRYRMLLARCGDRPVGYVVWRTATPGDERRRAVIVDFLTAKEDAHTLRALVSRVVVVAGREGAESVSMLTTQPWAASAVRRMGFLPRPSGNAWVVAGWEPHVPREWLHDAERWHLCMGDSDGDLWEGIAPGVV